MQSFIEATVQSCQFEDKTFCPVAKENEEFKHKSESDYKDLEKPTENYGLLI